MTLDDLRASHAAVITVAATADLLGVDERTVARGIAAGDLPCVQVGRRRLIPREPLLALLTAEPQVACS